LYKPFNDLYHCHLAPAPNTPSKGENNMPLASFEGIDSSLLSVILIFVSNSLGLQDGPSAIAIAIAVAFSFVSVKVFHLGDNLEHFLTL
jgi:hypothetical protein